ncbi:MAG TPA: serine hydrolase domain-containing protein [Thermomicrobiales bacterium]|nr:serine hydrolase domain-containing protein [Thermomicrobiales bacterium]
MQSISTGTLGTADLAIHGECDPAFQAVRDEFERNFTERGDLGASVCVAVEGETVVDLWGGLADAETGRPWERDTLVSLMSVTKGATALCAHMLHDRGQLDFDAPVVAYWPEFGKHGKDRITVRMLLTHQAGLPAIRTPVPPGKFLDWEWVIAAIEDEQPFWEPGTAVGYHALTFGFMVGELIRRISGKSLGTFFRDEVAEPLGLDYWIGLPDSEYERLCPLILEPDNPMLQALEADPEPQSSFRLAFVNNGGILEADGFNTPAACQAEFGSTGGIGNARSIAGMYAPLSLDGSIDGVRLVSPESLYLMGRTDASVAIDATMNFPLGRFALGFDKDVTDLGLPMAAFGHSGWGGANGFADPSSRLAFGYAMNRMNYTDRWEPLARAAYRSLGYREGRYGVWLR